MRKEITILHALEKRLDLGPFHLHCRGGDRFRVEDHACRLRHLTPTRSAGHHRQRRSPGSSHRRPHPWASQRRFPAGSPWPLQQSVPGSEFRCLNVSGSAAVRSSFATISAVFQPHRLARQQPHLNNLATFNWGSATMMRKFWGGSCSCRVPVVLGGFVRRLGYPRPPVFDGAGEPWVLIGTHQRDAPSRQDDGDVRSPTLRGWCCHGRHVVMSSHVPPSNISRMTQFKKKKFSQIKTNLKGNFFETHSKMKKSENRSKMKSLKKLPQEKKTKRVTKKFPIVLKNQRKSLK